MKKVLCDYCGKPTKLVNSKKIYGKDFGMIYFCPECRAYCRADKHTNLPVGRMANAELRHWKVNAHKAFDPLWQHGRFKGCKGAAYDWLAGKMGLLIGTHIGDMDVDQCKDVVRICGEERRRG